MYINKLFTALLCISSVFLSAASYAQQEINLPEQNISFSIPNSFIVSPSDTSRALFIARSSKTGASLNIIQSPGTKSLGPNRQLNNEILDSYKSVGLTSAEIESSSVKKSADGTAMVIFLVSYQSNSRTHKAYIALFNGAVSHYFLTMISSDISSTSSLISFQEIVHSISSETPAPTDDSESAGIPWMFLLIFFLIGTWVYFKFLNRKAPVIGQSGSWDGNSESDTPD